MDTEFSIFNIFTLLGGLAFFLYGMNVMSTALEKLTGGKLEKALQKMTSNKIKAILLGMGVTVAIQSSSAMTVMLGVHIVECFNFCMWDVNLLNVNSRWLYSSSVKCKVCR